MSDQKPTQKISMIYPRELLIRVFLFFISVSRLYSNEYDFIIFNPDHKRRQRLWRRPGDDIAVAIVFAAVTRALKRLGGGIERDDAAEMRAHRRQRDQLAVAARHHRGLAAEQAEADVVLGNRAGRNDFTGGAGKFAAGGAEMAIGKKKGQRRRQERQRRPAEQPADEFFKKVASIHGKIFSLHLPFGGFKFYNTQIKKLFLNVNNLSFSPIPVENNVA
jgi:hypothetical protein